jgi:hypothetical protein
MFDPPPVLDPPFEQLASHASAVHELHCADEAYLSPLRDVANFQKELHAHAPLAKVAIEDRTSPALGPPPPSPPLVPNPWMVR